MAKKLKTAMEMYLTLERLYGSQTAESWAARNLSYRQITMLKRAIESLDKPDENLQRVNSGGNNGNLFFA